MQETDAGGGCRRRKQNDEIEQVQVQVSQVEVR